MSESLWEIYARLDPVSLDYLLSEVQAQYHYLITQWKQIQTQRGDVNAVFFYRICYCLRSSGAVCLPA